MKKSKRKKRKENYYVVTISDNPKALTRAFRITQGSRNFWQIVISALVVILIVFVALLNYHNSVLINREIAYKASIDELQARVNELSSENNTLNSKIAIMSDTINEKNEVVNAIEEMSIPSGFPLSVAADIKETTVQIDINDEMVDCPALELTVNNGTYVLAPGNGTVTKSIEIEDGKWEIEVDHGNEYITYYTVPNRPQVKQGDDVAKGGPICEIKSEDKEPRILYLIKYSGQYIRPDELLKIDG